MSRTFELELLPQTFAVCRLNAGEAIPEWVRGDFVSVTKTADETSIVCDDDHVPADAGCERAWRALKVRGPLDFAMVGVLSAILAPLDRAQISVLTVSTYDTDYVLVKADKLVRAIAALIAEGHQVR